AEVMVDFYSPTRRGYQLVYTSPLLGQTTHTLKVRVTGTKNGYSSGFSVVLDAFLVGNASSCSPEPDVSFCYRQAKNCGSVSGLDNCGNSRTVASCGGCDSGQTCGGAGVPNVCGAGPVIDDGVVGTDVSQFNYLGAGWVHQGYVGYGSFYNSTRSSSATTNDSVSIAFTGTGIKLYGIKGPGHGKGGVRIDNGAETSIDFYNGSL